MLGFMSLETTMSFIMGKTCIELKQAIVGSRISIIVFSKKYANSTWCLDELVKIMECYSNQMFADMVDQNTDNGRWIYDVFLSFRGEDTRKNFTDHLYYALKDFGIRVFRDDNDLQGGKDISIELIQAIEASKISIIIFSKNYANSTWCLEELVKIVECKSILKQLVLPVFYKIDPSHVRNQTGSFEEAFVKHEQSFAFDDDRVLKWRMALTQIANLSGYDSKNIADGHEGTFIRSIVQKVSRDLNKTCLFVTTHPVGIDSRVNVITSKLDVGSGGIRIVGIWGMGGLGKSTIAKAVYNQLYDNFDGTCFLDNIRDISKQIHGQVRLQEQLLMAICKSNKIELESVDQGIIQLQRRLRHKKVLIVLDNIDDMSQLNALARSHDWFGAGSRIIITTRDEHLLKILKVDVTCTVDEMNENEALELFSWHAFHNSHPSEDYLQLSEHVVNHCGGLPLALEVLGSFLYGRRMQQWKDTLRKLKMVSFEKIQSKLRISFDGLDDNTYKDIFLDVACFFIGRDMNEVTQILDGCGFYPEIGIDVLIQKCLLKIDKEDKIVMHDLLRDMGREIVREESPKEPGRRSRIFYNDEVLDVLEKKEGTKVTEGLSLMLQKHEEKVFDTEACTKMKKLRLLQLNITNIIGDFGHLSRELRWLCWHKFPFKFLPTNFHLEKVVAIDLRGSQLTSVWKKSSKFLEKLTILNLSCCHHLTHTPNFLNLPNLEKLELQHCTSLVDVDNSIGSLEKLVFINLRDCISLKKLPKTLSRLTSLETLLLSGCSKLESLPKDLEKMESLTILAIEHTRIQQLTSSIVCLKKLEYLSLCRCEQAPTKSFASILWSRIFPRNCLNYIMIPKMLHGLESLKILCLKSCKLDAIPKDIGSLVSLVELNLPGNDFHGLPTSISRLPKLEHLHLNECTKLKQITDLPPNLKVLTASKCEALESISSLPMIEFMEDLIVDDCPNLVEISGLEKSLPFIGQISMVGSNKMKQSFKENILQGWMVSGLSNLDLPSCVNPEIIYRGIKNDDCLDKLIFQNNGRSLYLKASQINDFDLEGIIVCYYEKIMIIYTKGVIPMEEALIANDAIYSLEDQIWGGQLSNIEDVANAITNTIGETRFDLYGWSRDRCPALLLLNM